VTNRWMSVSFVFCILPIASFTVAVPQNEHAMSYSKYAILVRFSCSCNIQVSVLIPRRIDATASAPLAKFPPQLPKTCLTRRVTSLIAYLQAESQQLCSYARARRLDLNSIYRLVNVSFSYQI
jgi:hypothetical protein